MEGGKQKVGQDQSMGSKTLSVFSIIKGQVMLVIMDVSAFGKMVVRSLKTDVLQSIWHIHKYPILGNIFIV